MSSNEDQAKGLAAGQQQPSEKPPSSAALIRAPSNAENHEPIFVLPRQRSRTRRESRMFLVDGQIFWSDEQIGQGYPGGKRNSSVGLMFGSSMDLSGIGQSIDSSGGGGSGSEEAISYRIKWCRENIAQLKRQCWPMEKKLQVLRASKLFIKQHQGELKQSKQAKDVIASTSAIFDRYWRHFKREFANFLVIITPWEMRIKKIESHFGSVVASYFTFLRWIFWLNLANSLVMCSFVMVPELIENSPDLTGMRKGELGMQQPLGSDGKPRQPPEFNPTLGEMWEFEGFLKFSPIFYGYYSNVELSKSGFWRNPLAFLLSAILTYLFCFFCISRKLSQNTKLSRIGSKDDEYTFCWTVFVGWDFMIGNSETAYNKTSSLVMNLKEGILEEKEQVKDRDWRLIIRRVFANLVTIMLIVASAYVVTLAVQRSENLPEDASLLQKNELQLVMSGIQFMFPPLFDVIGIIEKYHPRKALSWQLGRILFLDFLNFYTLMFSLFGTVDQMGNQLNEVAGNITLFRKNTTYYRNLFTTTTTSTTSTTTLAPDLANATINTTNLISDLYNNTAISITPTPDNVTYNSSLLSTSADSNFNASTVLTSVLLASSTIMPSNLTTLGPTGSAMPTSDSMPELTTSLGVSSFTVSQATQLPVSSSTITQPIYVLETSTQASEVPVPSPTTILSFESDQMARPQTTSTPRVPEDEDYPDLGKVLITETADPNAVSSRFKRETRAKQIATKGSVASRTKAFRPKNRAIDGGDQRERDDSIDARPITRSSGHYSLRPTNRKPPKLTPTPSLAPHLPPIQDPYGHLGVNLRSPTMFGLPVPSEVGGNNDDDEPLEGRLRIDDVRSVSKPRIEQPFYNREEYERTQLTNTNSRVPTISNDFRLDDDVNEDTQSPGSETYSTEWPRNEFPEPITSLGEQDSNQMRPGNTMMTPINLSNESLTEVVSNKTIINLSTVANDLTMNGSSAGSTNDLTVPIGSGSELAVAGKSPIASQLEAITSGSSKTVGCKSNETIMAADATLVNDTSFLPNDLKSSQVGFNASEVNYKDCINIPQFRAPEILALNETLKDKLKSLCWETMFGQEMVKIVVMDLVMTVVSAVSFEFMRACFVRYCNRFFFWDLERGFPGYQDFKIAENVLHLVNNQSTVWMGMFFAPGLPAINTVKLAVLMYVRSWAVLTCNIPHETVFKVSKSNNFYYWILLINLLICILPVAYAVTWIRPSWHCGPFGGECRMYIVVTKLIKSLLPPEANSVFKYLTSPGAVIPILIVLILIIYYLSSAVSSGKEANKELKAQLKKDKEQEAAVPEITNTTVNDPAPTPAAAPGTSADLAPSTTVPAQPGIPGPSETLNPNNLIPGTRLSEMIPSQQSSLTPTVAGESRHKSYLVPPPM